MPLFAVRRFRDSGFVDELTTVKAENDLAAAELACGEKLRYSGETARLRARVTLVSAGISMGRYFFALEPT